MTENSHYLTYKELLARWRIKKADLIEILKKGVAYYDKRLVRRNMRDLAYQSDIDDVINNLNSFSFYLFDVYSYEENNPKFKPQTAPYLPTQPYLDEENDHFSKELSIAIKTWLVFYGPQGILKKGKHKKQISEYLRKNHKELSNEAINRIATMINADGPGAPKTE